MLHATNNHSEFHFQIGRRIQLVSEPEQTLVSHAAVPVTHSVEHRVEPIGHTGLAQVSTILKNSNYIQGFRVKEKLRCVLFWAIALRKTSNLALP